MDEGNVLMNVKKVSLGTASFGNQYGVLNSSHVDLEDSKLLLKIARDAGIAKIDTAPAYGKSEQILGMSGLSEFDVYTKIDAETWTRGSDASLSQLMASLARLRKSSLKGLTFHSAESFLQDPRRSSEFVSRAKDEGWIDTWGVSVYDPSEAEKIFEISSPDYLQAPVSIADRRFLDGEVLSHFREKGTDLHARSVFLQGLLVCDETKLPPNFEKWVPLFMGYSQAAKSLNISKFQLALLAVIQNPSIQSVVIGVNEQPHLLELIDSLRAEDTLCPEDFDYSEDLDLIDPRRWTT